MVSRHRRKVGSRGQGAGQGSKSAGGSSNSRSITQSSEGQCKSCQQALASYAKWYHDKLRFQKGKAGGGMKMGSGAGGGMGGAGRGRGGIAPEDGSATSFTKKKAISRFRSDGRILRTEKTNEKAPKGEVVANYQPDIAGWCRM